MIVTKERRELPCTLNNEQLADLSSTLAAKTMEIAELEERKKSVAADYKAKIDQMAGANNVIAWKVNSKMELREVECEWMFDWENSKKTLYRTDTGEKVSEDFIKAHESQRHFDDLKEAGEPVVGEPVMEEQPAPLPAQLAAPQNLIEGSCEEVK